MDELVEEFKARMHISHNSEDSNLKQLLSFSISALRAKCGEFDPTGESDTDKRAKELVFERTRYAYNDALEYFEDNFLSEINGLAIDLMDGEENAPV